MEGGSIATGISAEATRPMGSRECGCRVVTIEIALGVCRIAAFRSAAKGALALLATDCFNCDIIDMLSRSSAAKICEPCCAKTLIQRIAVSRYPTNGN